MCADGIDVVSVLVFGSVSDDAEHDPVEIEIAAKLPAVPGLVSGLSQAQRVAVLGLEAARLRAKFIAMHGDPFGCDVESADYLAADERKNIRASEQLAAFA